MLRSGIGLPAEMLPWSVTAAAAGQTFVLAWWEEVEPHNVGKAPVTRVRALRISPDGAAGAPFVLMEPASGWVEVASASSGTTAGIAFSRDDDRRAQIHRFTIDTTSVATHTLVEIPLSARHVDVIFTPSGFVATYVHFTNAAMLGVVPFSASTARDLGTGIANLNGSAIGANGRGVVLVANGAPVVAVGFDAALSRRRGEVMPAALAPAARQSTPAMAHGGGQTMMAWLEPLHGSSGRLMLRRFDRTGNALDAEPILAGTEAATGSRLAIAFTGRMWLVVWQKDFVVNSRLSAPALLRYRRDVSPVEQERAPVLPWEWRALSVVAGLFAIIRLPLYTHPGLILGWNSDAALFGLMARAIRDGSDFPLYFWGQFYLGTLTSMITAIIGAGPLALRLAAALEVALAAGFFWLALRRTFGRIPAMLALLWLAAGPSFLFHFTIAPIGAEQLLLAASVLFWYATRTPLTVAREWFVLGLIAGIGAWLHEGIVFLGAGIAVALLLERRPRVSLVAVSLLGALTGYVPAALARLSGDPRLYKREVLPWNLLRVGENIVETARSDLWLLLGDASPAGIVTGVCVLIFAGVGLRLRSWMRPTIIIVTTLTVSAAFWLLSTYAYAGAVRYIVPIVPLLYGAAAAGIVKWWRGGNWRRPAAAGAVVIVALGLYLPRARQAGDVAAGRSERYVDWPGTVDPRPTLAALQRGGFRVCYGEVWVAHKLEWITSPTVRFVPVRSVHRTLAQSLTLIRQPGPKCYVDNHGHVTALSAGEEAQWAASVVERGRRAGLQVIP